MFGAVALLLLQPFNYASLPLNYDRDLVMGLLFLVFVVTFNPCWWFGLLVLPLQILTNILRDSLLVNDNLSSHQLPVPWWTIFTVNIHHFLLLLIVILNGKRMEILPEPPASPQPIVEKKFETIACQYDELSILPVPQKS